MKVFSSIIPYLLLVSFYSGQFNNFDIKKIQAINDSPYHGVAVPLIGAYDPGKYTEKDFEFHVDLFRKELKKDILPWIFFNRFIGYRKGEPSHPSLTKSSYSRAINGMDIYNEYGALEDFYNIYRISLKISKKLGSPGIIIDPEAYNGSMVYKLSYLSKRLNRSKDKIKQRLKDIGKRLTDIAEEIYPEATIWFLFTGLSNPIRNRLNPFAVKEYMSVTYIIKGILERAKEKKAKLKIISGGEISLPYCYESFEDLEKRVIKRNKSFESILASCPMLHLGGTIAVWNNPDLRRNWMVRRSSCLKSNLKNIEDFELLIDHLFVSYNYVWIYAAKAAQYDPYKSEFSLPYSNVFGRSIRKFQ